MHKPFTGVAGACPARVRVKRVRGFQGVKDVQGVKGVKG